MSSSLLARQSLQRQSVASSKRSANGAVNSRESSTPIWWPKQNGMPLPSMAKSPMMSPVGSMTYDETVSYSQAA